VAWQELSTNPQFRCADGRGKTSPHGVDHLLRRSPAVLGYG
jgi:hypothetical protein